MNDYAEGLITGAVTARTLAEHFKKCETDRQVLAPLTAHIILDEYAFFELEGKRAGWIVLHPAESVDLRKFARDMIDFESQKYFLDQGIVGSLYGVYIVLDRTLDAGTVILLAAGLDAPSACVDSKVLGRVIRVRR